MWIRSASFAKPATEKDFEFHAEPDEAAAGVGGFFAMALDTFVTIPRRPFAWREFWLQCWFIARVSVLPTLMLAIPFTVLTVFTLNVLLVEFGAADFSGTGAASRWRRSARS